MVETMARHERCLVLEDVPKIENLEYPDIFADALSVAVGYRDDGVYGRCPLLLGYRLKPGHRAGIYGAVSTVTGRGWLIGFDEACFYWERHGVQNPHPSFAVSSLESYLEHYATMREAIRLLDHVPEFLWNQDCEYAVDREQAAGFIASAAEADGEAIRRYVTDTLAARQRPVIALLYLPSVPIVEMALLTGYESSGEVVLGRSPYQNSQMDNSGPYGYFRMADWERKVLAIIGIGEENRTEKNRDFSFLAIENALRYSKSHIRGTQYHGLAAYDAWERALLDDASITGVDDAIVSRRLLQHSLTAGFIASQKAFTVLPDCNAPSMGVVGGFVRRAAAGPGLIHGLMWDVWQVVGGYWRGVKAGNAEHRLYWENDEELRRFRDRTVREKAAKVISRARQVDAQAIQDLQEAKEEWEKCLGRGKEHPCPCWDKPCARV